ncbi:nucleotide exchange factor GrpE [Actinoallomurus sp. NPDC052308]|uniref:nucleotide exchange factor GrpE n=1 Tax=Actinoallomurus sp. NPDC052308 TaxID=3155530 RepID=UPI0034222616
MSDMRPDEPVAEDAGLATRLAELEDRWKRALADLENHRKRAARDAERLRSDERARTAAEWLPVVDNLERAIEHAGAEPDVLLEGIRAVRDQALALLARLGYPRQDDTGRLFDPTRHEAVATIPDADAPEGTIVQVTSPGYGQGENQLRPAQVVVSKGRQADGSGP